MTRRTPELHPFAFALYPVLYVYSTNVALIPRGDLIIAVAIAIGAAGLFKLGTARLVKSRSRLAAMFSLEVLFVFSYPLFAFARSQIGPLREAAWLPGGDAVMWLTSACLIGYGAWKLGSRPWATSLLNLAGAALVLGSLWAVASRSLDPGGRGSTPVGKRTSLENPPGRPDIFFIVLDGYARQDQLERVYGRSNSSFLSDLESLGFLVATASNAAYVQTELSLASTLNLSYIQDLLPAASAGADRAPLDKAIDSSRFAASLQSVGYSHFAVGTGFPALSFSSADYVIQSGESLPSLASLLRDMTPLATVGSVTKASSDIKRRAVLKAFEALRRLAAPTQAPRFVFAHVLAPHPAFVFAADGSRPDMNASFGLWDGSHYYAVGGTKREYISGYAGQLEFVNAKVLELVREIVRVNHLGNCILCHAPSTDRADLVRGAVPTPGQALPAPVTTPQYYERGSGIFAFSSVGIGRGSGAFPPNAPSRRLPSFARASSFGNLSS